MSTSVNPFQLENHTGRVITLIPARYQSSRLPGKPLIQISGKTVIQRTYSRVQEAKTLHPDYIYVVTDDDRIENHVKSWDGRVIRVDRICLNGTERIARALPLLNLQPPVSDDDIILNVQGDEPAIDPRNIDFLISKHQSQKNDVTTLHSETSNKKVVFSNNSCKIVTDINGRVLYGSRMSIPYLPINKTVTRDIWKEHIGIFVFRKEWLQFLLTQNATPLQICEDIEWLQTLELGGNMKSYQAPYKTECGVNTKEDVDYLSKCLQ